ncbi:MAG: DUF5522 domain-containing protein [Pyrinomonadaceae bacterium]
MKVEAGRTPLVEGEDYYWEGAAMVFTARFHLRRGSCCESNCRHCPYKAKKEERKYVAVTEPETL